MASSFRGLQWRLTWYFLFVILLTNLILFAFFYIFSEVDRRRSGDERFQEQEVQQTARLLSMALRGERSLRRVEPLLRVARPWWPPYAVFDRRGRVIATNQPPGGVTPPPELLDRMAPLFAGSTDLVSWEDAEETSHIAVRLRLPGQHVGALYTRLGRPRFRVPWRLWRRLLIAGVVVSGVFGFLLSRSLTRPVRRMAQAAEAVAAGNLSQRIDYHSRDELGQLAQKFNVMAGRIEELVDTLSKERDQLQAVLAQLQESERLRGELVANVSHELRTPLTSIRGHVEALIDGVAASPERQQQCLHTIADQVNYLSRLVNDLLSLARASLGQMKMEMEPTEIQSVVEQAVASFYPQAERAAVTVNLAKGEGLPLVQADPGRIAQVLANLLDNALRYTPQGGEVTVSLEAQEGYVLMTVADNGRGIPKEELPYVFDRFYRADPSRSRETGGSGLGLAIAREIVQAHGGDIWIESEVDRGTKVGVRLPVAEESISTAS